MPFGDAVTVVISRRVKSGKQAEFEALSVEMTYKAAEFPGYLGTTRLKPGGGEDEDYHIIFRFDSQENLQRWNDSDERIASLAKIEPLLVHQNRQEGREGIENWFKFPVAINTPKPSLFRMTLVSWLALYPTVTVISLLLGPYINQAPVFVQTFAVTAIVIFVMSYLLMPKFTHWFRKWIFVPSEKKT